MAGYYCQVTGVTFAAGRLQVSYSTAASVALATVQSALVGLNFPAAP